MFIKDRADSIISYLGFGGGASSPKNGDKAPTRALPSNWYTSSEMYELEKRAIFSRKWQLITHMKRFNKAGDWIKFSVANYEVIICKDRQGKINAFHNVCRHRAFPVVEDGESGCAKIFSCKYHGWSYGLSGKLAKAPGYQELDGFDKEKNSLFPIHVHVDRNNFIWINLDAKEKPEVAWEDDHRDIDIQERYKQFNFDDYEFDHFWEMEGEYNWKILADNYNECYHCATTHPDIPAVADLSSYSVQTWDGQIVHDAATTEEQRERGLVVASTYYLPNVSTNITPHFFMIQRFVPSSASKSSMQYQVFRSKNATDEQFKTVNDIYKRVMSEDKYLCNRAQQNINAGIFVNGELHPRLEKGPLYFQKMVRDAVTEHWRREQVAKQEIWPARQTVLGTGNGAASLEDMKFCQGLSCSTQPPEGLAW